VRLTLSLTHRCNLRCLYCYTGRKLDRNMPVGTARRAIDLGLALARGRGLTVAFFGGEPMLEPGLMGESCRWALERGGEMGERVRFSVSSNGTLLDGPRLDLLVRHGFEVQVSMDGSRAAQDAGRRYEDGGSSHAAVLGNLRRLLREGLDVQVVAVVHPANVAHLPESFDELAELGVPHVYFVPDHAGPWTQDACERFEAALRALGERWLARLRHGEGVRLDPLHAKIAAHVLRDRGGCAECPFGVEELAVSPSGRLYPCDRLIREDDDPAACIGDLDRGLDEARRDALVAERGRLDPECAACELRPRCTRWCACVNYQSTGAFGAVSPVQCWLERCFIAEADRVGAALWAERAPAFLERFYGGER
jgi:uncharacterized protein